MQVTELSAEGLKRGFAVTVPAAEVAAGRDKRLTALAKDLRLPGFRPGKVPMGVVKQRYGQAVLGEVLEEQVNEASRKVVSDRGLKPALQPKIELVNFADGADLEFRMDVEVLPDIPLPDFSAISLERLKTEPSDEQVSKALEGIATRNRKLEDITEARGAEKGEIIIADFVGRIGEEAFPGGTGSDMSIEIAGPGFIPGFTEQLEGIKAGETRHIDVTFPAEYGAAELAGKAARFEITAKALKRGNTPAVDDEFAKSIGLPDLATLQAELKGSLVREYEQLSRLKLKRGLLDALAAQASFPVPVGMVDNEFGQIWQRVEADMKAGKLDADDAGKDEDTLKAEYRTIAERRIRLGLLLSEIGRSNNIEVGKDEIARAMRQEAGRYPGQEQQVFTFFQKNPQAVENLRAPLFEEKVIDFMLELAKVEDRQVTPEELSAQANA